MGTILQERVAPPRFEKVSVREGGEWKKKAPWNNNRPDASGNKMGRRQSQRKSQQSQNTLPNQDPNQDPPTEKKLQQRRRNKPNAAAKCNNAPQHSAGGGSKSHLPTPAGDRKEAKVQQDAQRCVHKHAGFRGSRRTPALPCHRPSESGPDPIETHLPNPSVHGEGDSDTDLSESERLPAPPSGRVPPQLDLQPEVIQPEDSPSCSLRSRPQGHSSFLFPDFLPPPFNSWSLSQLAVFYNLEGRVAPRPRPVGPLERYLERLLQLEWHQIQTVQEESGKSAVSDVISSCHRTPTSTSTRLSSPKSILQCQRAFPLTFLSSLAGHSALLSHCACTLCHIHYSTCSTTSCRSSHGHVRQSRLSPLPERQGPPFLPKRSYSETRVHQSERSSASRAQRFSSPVRGSSHLRRMQALGNIRNPAQGVTTTNHSTATDWSVHAGTERSGTRTDVSECRLGGVRKRSFSEQRRSGAERRGTGSERMRSGSECRRRGAEQRRNAELREQEIKPDAVAAIMDNLPASKYSPMSRTNRTKQVEFVT